MNYRFTQFWFYVRKVLRLEPEKGYLKRFIFSVFMALTLVEAFDRIPILFKNDALLIQNTFYYLRGERKRPDNIIIVSIDDETYKKLKLSTRKPLPRELYALAIKKIHEHKPKVLIMDMYFHKEEGEEHSTIKIAEALKTGPSTLAEAPFGNEQKYESDPLIRSAVSMEIPMEIASGLNMFFINRSVSKSKISPLKSVPLLQPLRRFVNDSLNIPSSNDLVNFYGEAGSIRHISLWEFFSDSAKVPSGFLKDKIVFLGVESNLKERATSSKETFVVPVSNKEMYGVEIHATIAGNLIDSSWLRRLDPFIEILFLKISWSILIFGILILNPVQSLTFAIVFITIYFLISFYCFVNIYYFVPGLFMLLLFSPVIFGGASFAIANQALTELKETKKMLGLKL